MKFSEALAKIEEVEAITGELTEVNPSPGEIVLEFDNGSAFGSITIIRKDWGEFEPKELCFNVLGDEFLYVWDGEQFVETEFSPAPDPTAGPLGWLAT